MNKSEKTIYAYQAEIVRLAYIAFMQNGLEGLNAEFIKKQLIYNLTELDKMKAKKQKEKELRQASKPQKYGIRR